MFNPQTSPPPTNTHPLSSSPSKYESNRKGDNKNRASYPANNGTAAGRMTGTLESKSKRNTMIRQSSSHGNLTDEQSMDFLYNTMDRGQVKRTKSFWKFGKSDTEDIVEGMAMWKHRDLIQPEHEMRMEEERIMENTLKRNKDKSKAKRAEPTTTTTTTMTRPNNGNRVKDIQQNITVPLIDDHAKYQLTKSEIDQRIGKTKEQRYYDKDTEPPRNGKVVRDSETELGYAEDEDDMTAIDDSLEPKSRQSSRMKSYEAEHNNLNNKLARKYYDDRMLHQDMEDERFYDDESMSQEVVVMKTVKRKEILKQYYSSGTSDTERHSSSSDPYDCIVVQDHHVTRNKNNTNNFNNNTNNRKNNKNKEMTTFRSEFAMSKNNMDSEQTTATILPRTKLVKNGHNATTAEVGTGKKNRDKAATDKKPQNVDPKLSKNFEEASKRNSLSSAKSYGPWYDLWGANGNGNNPNSNTLISQK